MTAHMRVLQDQRTLFTLQALQLCSDVSFLLFGGAFEGFKRVGALRQSSQTQSRGRTRASQKEGDQVEKAHHLHRRILQPRIRLPPPARQHLAEARLQRLRRDRASVVSSLVRAWDVYRQGLFFLLSIATLFSRLAVMLLQRKYTQSLTQQNHHPIRDHPRPHLRRRIPRPRPRRPLPRNSY